MQHILPENGFESHSGQYPESRLGRKAALTNNLGSIRKPYI